MPTKQYLYKMSILNRKNSNPLEAISYYSGEPQIGYASNSEENVIWNYLHIPDKKEDSEKYIEIPQFLKFKSFNKELMSNSRSILWEHVYNRETRADAQFARLFELSIPGFATKEQAINCIKEFSKILVKEGMIADCSIHKRKNKSYSTDLINMVKNKEEKVNTNIVDYTGFIMCTLRDYENGIFVNKNRIWNDKKKMELWRKEWVKILAKLVNDFPIKQKEDWEKKLTIYSEYENIKKEINADSFKIKSHSLSI